MEEKKIKIKYEVGYQLTDTCFSFRNLIGEFIDYIDTVYFPWTEIATCRNSIANNKGHVNWMAQFIMERDLRWLRDQGIKLNLLFNANCYGEHAVSKYLENQIQSVIEHLTQIGLRPEIITTTSPAIARMIKKSYRDILVRASVNMRIGSVEGMEYLADFFDEYNIQRDYNRDFERIAQLKAWTDEQGKGLYMLANSGCFRNCSAQIFHDNLVSHDADVAERDNVDGWHQPNCRRYLQKKEHWFTILQATWIRPEDIHNYAEFFPVIKLATRQHERPWLILDAYTNQRYYGSVTDLLEPGFSKEISPYVIANQLFPEDWFARTTNCKKNCHSCGYCKAVLEEVLVDTRSFSFGQI